jgi:hypothetical protein
MSNHFKNKTNEGKGRVWKVAVSFPNTENESPYFKRITACARRVKMKYRHENVRTKEGRKK